ncbi:hypothetical protein CBL_01223 [Carabus blaptoides fortunei]
MPDTGEPSPCRQRLVARPRNPTSVQSLEVVGCVVVHGGRLRPAETRLTRLQTNTDAVGQGPRAKIIAKAAHRIRLDRVTELLLSFRPNLVQGAVVVTWPPLDT